MDAGIKIMQFRTGICDQRHGCCFSASNIYFTSDPVCLSKFELDFVHHRNDLLRAPAQTHPLAGKSHAVTAADEKLTAQFVLKLVDLP